MERDEKEKIQHMRAADSLQLMRELLPLMSPVGKHEGWTREQHRTLAELLTAIARSTESTLLLCAYGQLWDAEVLVRSVFEGTLKFCYLMQSKEHFAERHREYAHELFNIGCVKDHRKAAEFLRVISNPDDAKWKPIRDRLLTEDQIREFNGRRDGAGRRNLETRWGFTGLMAELSRSDDPGLAGITGFAHGYSIASHIQHADAIGVAISLERDFRSEKRRDAIHAAHQIRLISDVFAALELRLVVGYRHLNCDPKPLHQARGRIDELMTSFGPIYEAWMTVEYPPPSAP